MFESNMRIPDNEKEIYNAINNCFNTSIFETYKPVYSRSGKNQSSHFKQSDAMDIQGTQKGLYFKYGDLPSGDKTILFFLTETQSLQAINRWLAKYKIANLLTMLKSIKQWNHLCHVRQNIISPLHNSCSKVLLSIFKIYIS